MKNTIGLDVQQAQQLTEKLNDLLANYQLYYQNLRGLHWNINGREFFELHQKFEEFYEDAFLKIDEIAERILTLGGQPLHALSNYLKQSEIKEATEVCDAVEGVTLVVENLSILLRKERSILTLASQAADEGTVGLMSEYIAQIEKTLWMLHAYLGQ